MKKKWLSLLTAHYENEEILVSRKTHVFLISLLSFKFFVLLYPVFMLITGSPFMGDMVFLGILFFFLFVALIFFSLGKFNWAVYLSAFSLLVLFSIIVLSGETIDELKLYNMAFFHSLVIVFMTLMSKNLKGIILAGMGSLFFLTLYLIIRLIPSAINMKFYMTAYTVSMMVIIMETTLGILIYRLLFKSLTEIQYKAYHDEKTGLPNRNSMIENLNKMEKVENLVALVFYRIENYRELMLTWEETVLIEILGQIATGLEKEHGTTCYLVTHDTLGVVIPDPVFPPQDEIYRLQERFSQPLLIGGNPIQLVLRSSHIQAEALPLDKKELINTGLLGLYKGVEENRRHVFLMEEEKNAIKDRIHLVHELTSAVDRGYCRPYYQSLQNQSGEIIGYEALARWTRENGNLVSPSLFIPLMEKSGMMGDFFMKMLEKTLKDMGDGNFERKICLYINLSPELINSGFNFKRMTDLIDRYAIEHTRLGFEITEASFARDRKKSYDVVNRLKEEGFSLALDDFGTGYSNLSQLLQLPINKIKFDKTIVDEVLINPRNGELFITLVHYFNKFGYETLAEGVETREQFNYLKGIGCQQFQGYLFSQAVPPEKIGTDLIMSEN